MTNPRDTDHADATAEVEAGNALHTAKCCETCGCKWKFDDCPVVHGRLTPTFQCTWCED